MLRYLTAGAAAAALQILSNVTAARLSSPTVFGQYAFWLSIVTVLQIGALVRADHLILVANSKSQALRIGRNALSIVCIVSAMLFVPLAFYFRSNGEWLPPLVIALSLVSSANTSLVRSVCVRFRSPRTVVRIQILRPLISCCFIATAAVFTDSWLWLLCANSAGFVAASGAYRLFSVESLRLANLSRHIRGHRGHYSYGAVANAFNAAYLNGMPAAFKGLYGDAEAGLIFLIQRFVFLPVGILISSIGEVVQVERRKTLSGGADSTAPILRAFSILFLVVSLIFMSLNFDQVFWLILGPSWEQVGISPSKIVAALLIMTAAQVRVSPLSGDFVRFGAQKLQCIWEVARFFLTIGLLLLVARIYPYPTFGVITWAALGTISYLVLERLRKTLIPLVH